MHKFIIKASFLDYDLFKRLMILYGVDGFEIMVVLAVITIPKNRIGYKNLKRYLDEYSANDSGGL